jgi:hypothetical protein
VIEMEIRNIIASGSGLGDRIGEIANQFRCGRDVSELITLLDSSDSELVSLGAWIVGELQFHLYDSERILSRLRGLLDHPDAAVRFHALGALFPSLNPQDPKTQAVLQKMRCDANEGVRRTAEAAWNQLLTPQRPDEDSSR